MDRAFQRIRSLMLRDTFYSVPPIFTQNMDTTTIYKSNFLFLYICTRLNNINYIIA